MAQNVIIGFLVMALCLVIQCAVAGLLIRLIGSLRDHPVLKPTLGALIVSLIAAMLMLMLGNLLQVCVWAMLFRGCGEFADFETAFYHSLVNFTTLGYGDLVMSPEHRLLGALEAANGVMMFGLTTTVLFSVINTMVQRMRSRRARHHDSTE